MADFLEALTQTWPARMGRSFLDALMLPGDVYAGRTSVMGDDGHTNPEVINRSADLSSLLTLGAGGVPGAANELRAGIRPYRNVPDSLMGFRRNGPQKTFDEIAFKHEQPVQVVFPDREILEDVIKGLNPDHAVEVAYRNWPDAIHIQGRKK